MWAHVRIAVCCRCVLRLPPRQSGWSCHLAATCKLSLIRRLRATRFSCKGEHRGVLTLTKTVTVEGEPGASLVGPGTGSVVIVTAPGAVVRGLIVRGSGIDLEALDAGVFVEKSAAGAIVENNRLVG